MLTDNTRGNGYTMHKDHQRDNRNDHYRENRNENYRGDRNNQRFDRNRRSRSRERGENHRTISYDDRSREIRNREGLNNQVCKFGLSCRDRQAGRCLR